MDDYAQYDDSEQDLYSIPGSTCLINLLNLTDTAALNTAEEAFSTIRLAELKHSPVFPSFSLLHLQQIHRRLFADVYPFAGEIRLTEISKGGHFFLPCGMIEAAAMECFAQLHAERDLTGLGLAEFGSEVGYFLGRINKIHPFREGNGRTQRILFDQLANQNGYAIEWAAMSKEAMACREARTIDNDGSRLRKLIALHTVAVETSR